MFFGISAPNGNKLPAKLHKSKDGTYTAEFNPTVVGKLQELNHKIVNILVFKYSVS